MPVSPADVDRLFLQATLSRGILSKQLALVLWEKSVQAVNASNNALNIRFSKDDDSWNEFVSRINKSLDKLDLEFRTLHDETSGRELYGLKGRRNCSNGHRLYTHRNYILQSHYRTNNVRSS
ncbi:hypothetical protein CPB84DRAFT_892567 [Gymnopilus junonius]|uniref:Non-structural maintenance of chromosomes element 1 homolog n=1 Tax=Gymnopilus junonius TaxID=109634 RepID=A0A9P5TNS6_GYMJU|nr:hypothetical protein CPB84DRAFT_892567 [Gymnopilus junonius]